MQNAVWGPIAVSVAMWKNRYNAEIMPCIVARTRLGLLKNLSNAAVSSRIGHIFWIQLPCSYSPPEKILAGFYATEWTMTKHSPLFWRVVENEQN